MNSLCGCAMHIKLAAEVSFKPVVEKVDSPTQTGNIKKKIQRDRIWIRVFNEKRLIVAELPFSRIKDLIFNDELIKNHLNDAKQKKTCGVKILATKLQKQSSLKTVIL